MYKSNATALLERASDVMAVSLTSECRGRGNLVRLTAAISPKMLSGKDLCQLQLSIMSQQFSNLQHADVMGAKNIQSSMLNCFLHSIVIALQAIQNGRQLRQPSGNPLHPQSGITQTYKLPLFSGTCKHQHIIFARLPAPGTPKRSTPNP